MSKVILKKYVIVISEIILVITIYFLNYKFSILKIIPSNEEILALVFPCLLGLVGVLTAISILSYQLIYNRYPLYPLRKKINKSVGNAFLSILLLTISSFVLWLFDLENDYCRFIILLFLFNSFSSFFRLIFRYQKFDVHENIKFISNDIIKKIEKEKNSTDDIFKMMEDVKVYFEDSLSRDEEAFIESIIILYKDVLEAYIRNLDKLRFNDQEDKKTIEKLNEELISSLFNNFQRSTESNLKGQIIISYERCIVTILRRIIEFEKVSLFDYSMKEIRKYYLYSISNDNNVFSKSTLKIFRSLHLDIVTDHEKTVFEEKIVNATIETFIKPIRVINHDLPTIYDSLRNLSNIVVNRLNNGKEDSLIEPIESLFENARFTITRDKNNQHTDLWMNIFFLSEEIMNKENVDIINLLIDQIDKTIKIALKEMIEDAIFHCAFVIKTMDDKLKDDDCIQKMKERKYSYTLLVLDFFPEAAFLFLPKYKEIITKATKENININDKIDELNEIFDKLVRSDKSPILYSFLNEINKIIIELKIDNRINQEKMISIYKTILTDSLILRSTENFKMILYKYKELVKELDDNSKISENLVLYIIKVLEEVSRYLTNINSDNIAKYFLSFLTNLAEKTKTITSKKENKERVVLIIYRLTLEAIESKNHNLIRICSNSLGWYAKELFDSGDYENFKNCINYATKIYVFIDEMGFDVSLKIFIGTLFVILGSYLYGKNQQHLYAYVLNKASRLPDNTLFQVSKKLRESSTDTWDENLKIDSKKSMDKFISDLGKKKSA